MYSLIELAELLESIADDIRKNKHLDIINDKYLIEMIYDITSSAMLIMNDLEEMESENAT